MNNIHSVHIENFQSHLDTYIEFDQGLNMIVGQSDSGKTAIIRALRWVLFNQPRGTDFLRISADFVRVTVTFTNGTVICRERTASKNRYTIRQQEQDDLILEGFGIHVPTEVLEAHGMGHLRVDTDHDLALHVSQQLDGPFLLEETSSTRAKVLGRISGAHFLDMAIRQTTRDVSQLNQRTRQEEETIDKLKKELEPFAHIDLLKEKLDLAGQEMQRIETLMARKKHLEKLAHIRKQMIQEETVQQNRLRLVKDVTEWENRVVRLEATLRSYQTLIRIHKRQKVLSHDLSKCLLWIDKTKGIEIAERQYNQLEKVVERRRTLKTVSQRDDRLKQQFINVKRSIQMTSFVDELNSNQIQHISHEKERLKTLKKLQTLFNKSNQQSEEVKKIIDHLPSVNLLLERVSSLENEQQQLLKLNSLHSTINEYDRRMREGAAFVQSQTEIVEKYEEERLELLIQKGTCPTCGQEIKEKEHHHLL
ncbi:AAA family ATPase [Alkalihalobacillus hemicellulosilyticus]|uniref:Nuclease SbcCD subunit C n=1 Tax=Halalkalibacter hemicellulosilyticusJCM 9152 TaxID=1236971 RepID=W4QFW7_9BACI|nr:AAA family ATPase [Halalkalibacter hemicellulosilyticus]GAE30827.1 DNA double-strand break repair Rad50 ATPase [Halalkalibacter hemicellulosilyticusJCM 9152]